MNKCIICLCSNQKRSKEPCLAIDMYDNGVWRVIRKNSNNVDVYALSAKYGLINAKETIIENYDLKLENNKEIYQTIKNDSKWLDISKYNNILISAAQDYLDCIPKNIKDKSFITSKRFYFTLTQIKKWIVEDKKVSYKNHKWINI
ncbi:MAG: hypothetical protein PHS80_13815 [Methanothrix sp.]|nr:hypothetical protein [Methanothrix sp.]